MYKATFEKEEGRLDRVTIGNEREKESFSLCLLLNGCRLDASSYHNAMATMTKKTMANIWKWQQTHFQDASTKTWRQRWNKSQWQSPGWILTLNLKQFLDLQNGQWWEWWWRSWVGGTVARTEGISSDTWLSSGGFPYLQCPLDNVHHHCNWGKLPPQHMCVQWYLIVHCKSTGQCPLQASSATSALSVDHVAALWNNSMMEHTH